MPDLYEEIVEKIIREQETIIGPLAIDQAKKVSGITVDVSSHNVKLAGDEKNVLEQLVKQYANLFGQASVEVCKDAVKKLNVPKEQLPSLLQ